MAWVGLDRSLIDEELVVHRGGPGLAADVHLCGNTALSHTLSRDIALRRAGQATYAMLAFCQASRLTSAGNERMMALLGAWA
jgi:hypothetical protein